MFTLSQIHPDLPGLLPAIVLRLGRGHHNRLRGFRHVRGQRIRRGIGRLRFGQRRIPGLRRGGRLSAVFGFLRRLCARLLPVRGFGRRFRRLCGRLFGRLFFGLLLLNRRCGRLFGCLYGRFGFGLFFFARLFLFRFIFAWLIFAWLSLARFIFARFIFVLLFFFLRFGLLPVLFDGLSPARFGLNFVFLRGLFFLLVRRVSFCITFGYGKAGQHSQPCSQRQRRFSICTHGFNLLGRPISDID